MCVRVFSIGVFFGDSEESQDSEKRDGLSLFQSTISTHSRTFRHLFVILHLTLLPSTLNCIACNYQTATQ